ncbi:MAG: FKBP-type peptidyl-prolyl cis-trans isomerase [Muribaculaceae bacterium]|nr:FKBP-type peptidyl-prolyl cis-trans isomerase [Muribaculaceae bacterium]
MGASLLRRLAAAAAVVAALAVPAHAAAAGAAADSTSVAVGTMLGHTIGSIVDEFEQGGVALDRAAVAEAAARAIRGERTGIDAERAQEMVSALLEHVQGVNVTDSFDTASQQRFLDEAAAREGAVRTPSGVVLEVIVEGEGPMPGPDDTVRLSYVGRLSDDTVFDATDDPVLFPISQLTPGLAEGLMLMRPGGRYRLTIPASGAYGEQGIPGVIPGRAALRFNIELLSVEPRK